MATRHNIADCIQISESAAKKLKCKKRENVTFVSSEPIIWRVSVGDKIQAPYDTEIAYIPHKNAIIKKIEKLTEYDYELNSKFNKIQDKVMKFDTKNEDIKIYDILNDNLNDITDMMKMNQEMILDLRDVLDIIKIGDDVLIEKSEKSKLYFLEDVSTCITANKLKKEFLIKDIIEYSAKLNHKKARRFKIMVEAEYEMFTGDKLTSRHATKGIVKIVPDSDMPYYIENGNKVYIEAIVSPYGIMSRRSFGVIREMLVNKLILEEEQIEDQTLDHFSDELSISNILKSSPNTCKKNQLYINERKLNEKTFIGPLYFIRLDKHVIDNAISIGQASINHKKFRKNSSLGGQKMITNIYNILKAKGAENIALNIMQSNDEPFAMFELNRLVDSLEWAT
jgi:DNA-directed RNA polymerase beta subunit